MMSLGTIFFFFIMLGVHWASGNFGLIIFIKLGKFGPFFPQILSLPILLKSIFNLLQFFLDIFKLSNISFFSVLISHNSIQCIFHFRGHIFILAFISLCIILKHYCFEHKEHIFHLPCMISCSFLPNLPAPFWNLFQLIDFSPYDALYFFSLHAWYYFFHKG